MARQSLIIDARDPQSGPQDEWTCLNNCGSFINSIKTPQLAKDTNIGKLVSGIPSAFARVDLFKTAIDFSSAQDGLSEGDERNLVSYYEMLVQEWRGLIACIALDYAHINVRSVDLVYSDGKSIDSTKNIYEPKGAFGNMLLKRAPRWCEQNLPKNQSATPYINIIKYYDKVVGATSPESLLFTSTGYKADAAPDRPWIDASTGKFTDPIEAKMTDSQYISLYSYVSHLLRSLNKMQNYYGDLPHELSIDYGSIRMALEKWKGEIEVKAHSCYPNIDFSLGSTPPVSADFKGPFRDLFCYEDILWGLQGTIYDSERADAIMFDPKKVLLDEQNAKIVKLALNVEPEELDKLPILVLTADVKGSTKNEKAYFALPLSAQGLDVFGITVSALVGMAGNNTPITSKLSAVYDPNARTGNLEIILKLQTINGAVREYKRVYTSDSQIRNKDILIWPNFISRKWNSYYMYSEMPHNGITGDYQAYPFVGVMNERHFRILKDEDNKPMFLSKGGQIAVSPDEAELLVKCDDAVAANPYKYEIYWSNKPFKGVCFKSPVGCDGGYILINYSTAPDSGLPLDKTPTDRDSLTRVGLGVDFGSTNTSIAYSDNNKCHGFSFKNQRVSLMGYELPTRRRVPRENQVFFFQGFGPEVKSNSIKSVLTLHDPCRLPALKPGETVETRNSRAVIGGFPSFSDNLPFESATSKRIALNFPGGVGQVSQIHNMKWESDSVNVAYKSAYLQTLMLHVYAALFAEDKVPTSLRWSYPSAMEGSALLNSYRNIWDGLQAIRPVKVDPDLTDLYELVISTPTHNLADTDVNSDIFAMDNPFGGMNTSDASDPFGSMDSSDPFGSIDSSDPFGLSDSSNSSSPFDAFDLSPKQSRRANVNRVDLQPDAVDGNIEYKPLPLIKSGAVELKCLSESESVANYVSDKTHEANTLNICFDVGGSTTDISALYVLRDEENNDVVTMVKQNSIRFAAQRVSQAVGQFPELKNVLKEICLKYNIQMVGLNMGPDSYNKDTAPYFFDQIVNRLDAEQLTKFYSHIAANCSNLMVLNMYVTGLMMFYAGELSHKLADDLNRTTLQERPGRRSHPRIRISFAGKGSRLFQWLAASHDNDCADQYYRQMFAYGYGKAEYMQVWNRREALDIVLPSSDDDVKYEVSMGLAKSATKLHRPSVDLPSEIIGEMGWQLIGNDGQARDVSFTNSITPEMMRRIGADFVSSGEPTRFLQFMGLFYRHANALFRWKVNVESLKNGCSSLTPTTYTRNMEEYTTAMKEATPAMPFSFVAPIIIVEGMQFYEQTLLKNL